MKDYSELKRLSDAATPGNWNHYRHGVIKGGPSIQFTNGSAQQQIAMTTGADWMRPDEQCANADFIAAANPAAVLALIAEVEDLRKGRTYWQAECLKRGFEYVRESDDHYVLADIPEMAELLGMLLGVEVRSKDNDSYGETVSMLQDMADANSDAFHRAYELEKENESLKKDAARFKFIEQDASSGMSNIYGDEWVSVIDSIINEDNNK